MTRPVVWTVAGSDPSAGAGLQADLKTLESLGVQGASIVTALTAQSLHAVHAVEAVSLSMLDAQWAALAVHPPAVIKVGMLHGVEQVRWLAARLREFPDVPVICDPVLRASDGTVLQTADVRDAFFNELLPQLTLVTPNRPEACQWLGLPEGADTVAGLGRQWQAAGARAVLIKGGHASGNTVSDYFAAGADAFWMHQPRLPGSVHGSGCVLASAIAAALALGYALDDAVVLANRYLHQGWRLSAGEGQCAHAGWPQAMQDIPRVSDTEVPPAADDAFPEMGITPIGLYPVVDSIDWVRRLLPLGVSTLQLRIKQRPAALLEQDIAEAVELGRRYRARVFINDHWEQAIRAGAYGVHLGQEDLDTADLAAMRSAGLRLGISNHSEREIARALTCQPSYMALGPIYETTTKVMRFAPQGLARLRDWVRLLAGQYPLVAIGGIDASRAADVLATGVGNVAVVRAITEASDTVHAVRQLQSLVSAGQ